MVSSVVVVIAVIREERWVGWLLRRGDVIESVCFWMIAIVIAVDDDADDEQRKCSEGSSMRSYIQCLARE